MFVEDPRTPIVQYPTEHTLHCHLHTMLVRNVQRLARTRQTQTVTKHAPQSYKPVRAYATGRRPRLENKVALITGASAGIGHETSLLFAEEGAKLVLVDIDEQKGQETLNAVHKQGGEAIFVKADVSKAKVDIN